MNLFATLHFDLPIVWLIGLPVICLLGALAAVTMYRRGIPTPRWLALTVLRGLALLLILFLLARPVRVFSDARDGQSRPVLLLMDRSESMSLEDLGASRYQLALNFARDQLLPALQQSGMRVETFLFDEFTEAASGPALTQNKPTGRRTNLAGAIHHALGTTPLQPLAVLALSDGAANVHSDNTRALVSLVESQAPLIAVGFGSSVSARTLSLRQVDAPTLTPPKSAFQILAQLEMNSPTELPSFDLLLFRNGQLLEKKSVQPGHGSRYWTESFRVTEAEPGLAQYTVQFLPPDTPGLRTVNTRAAVAVRVSDERELRVLFVQGALTWDYKFIGLALRGDPAIHLTGLTRTSKNSVFRQNVESAGELLDGFPTTLEALSHYRAIVLSDLKPSELSPNQQELLARFCGELGGGLLLLGGPATFDASWQGSRLEQLLPVVFASNQGVRGLDQPFHLDLTDAALQHPVFQVDDRRAARDLWSGLPPFIHYGRVDSAKPGATVWARHHDDEGPNGRRILMAWQRYGAGISAVFCLQNFWHWRLARESEPQQFDRFWRQLLRFLSESTRQDLAIHLPEQNLQPNADIQFTLERQPSPDQLSVSNSTVTVRVQTEQYATLVEQQIELRQNQPVPLTFHPTNAGLHHITVLDSNQQPMATRTIEVRDVNLEFLNTARDMETLQQWAAVTDGLAVKAEECEDASQLIRQIKDKVEQSRRTRTWRQPAGINPYTLTLLLGLLAAEFLLRKRWNLI